MGSDDQGTRRRFFRTETIRGEPYQVGGRTLIPQARVASWGRANAKLGANGVEGWGGGFVHIRPLAFVELTAGCEHLVRVTDATGRALRQLLSAALAMVLLFAVIRWSATRLCRPTDRD